MEVELLAVVDTRVLAGEELVIALRVLDGADLILIVYKISVND